MKNVKNIEDANNCMNDLLLDSRHFISKTFLKEARSKDLALRDNNVVIFSHQDVATVAAPYTVNGEELNKNQSLISLYFHGGTGYSLPDGFYTIQGNLDKNRINEKSLLLLNADGKVVQELKIEQKEAPKGSVNSNQAFIDVTDAHVQKFNWGIVYKVSGKFLQFEFEMLVHVQFKPKGYEEF